MNHSLEIFYMVFVPNNQSPEVLKPGKQALNLPSTPVTAQFSAFLGSWFFPSSSVRCDHFNTALISKLIVKFITVISFIANQFIRCIPGKTAVNSGLDELYLMGRSAFNVSGDRKTSSVCDGHDLGAFAALCLADSKTPFFAGAKLPSMNASQYRFYRVHLGLLPALGQCAGKPLAGPIAGTADGMSGTADTAVVNPSMERRCAVSKEYH